MKFLKLGVSAVIVLIFSACSDNDVNGVKNGVMKNFSQSLTVGQAIESWAKTQKCDTTKWESFKTDRGEKIVSFKCSVEKESSLSAIGLNTQSILQSHDVKDVNFVYSKLEGDIENYESKKQELNKGLAKLEADVSEINQKVLLAEEEANQLKNQTDNAYKDYQSAENEYSNIHGTTKGMNSNDRDRLWKESYAKKQEALKQYQNMRDEYNKANSNVWSEKSKQNSAKRSLENEKERVKKDISAINTSIEKGKKDVQKIEMTSDALEQLKKVNLVIQFTLSADGKSFVPSYEGVEYSFKDSKMYAQDIATSTQAIMMGVEVLKRFGGFGGTGGLLTSAYLNQAYKVSFQPEFYEQRK